MTREEAEKIAKIMLTADGWCSSCASGLLAKFSRAFPEHADIARLVKSQAERIGDVYREADWSDEKINVWDIPLATEGDKQ